MDFSCYSHQCLIVQKIAGEWITSIQFQSPLFIRKRVYQKIEISSLDAFNKIAQKFSRWLNLSGVSKEENYQSKGVFFFIKADFLKVTHDELKKQRFICFHMVFDRLPYDSKKLKFSFSRCNVWWQQRAPSISRMIIAKGVIYYHCRTGHETWKIHAQTGFERVPARLRLALFPS